MSSKRTRMSGVERREQLIKVARQLFAKQGFAATSVEEIAAKAKVSKPVVYEHFGGKEGIYAVIVDREVQQLTTTVTATLSADISAYLVVEGTAIALLDYIESNTDGFRILVRDTPAAHASGSFSSVIGEVAAKVEYLFVDHFKRSGLDPNMAPLYSQMLVGLISQVGQWWLEERSLPKKIVAAHVVNLTWNGMRNLEVNPPLATKK